MQHISQSGSSENIDRKDTWFTPDLDEVPRETPTHVSRVAPENNINMVTSSQPVHQLQESPDRKGESVYELTKLPVSERVLNTSNLPKFCFDQESPNTTSGMPYHEE